MKQFFMLLGVMCYFMTTAQNDEWNITITDKDEYTGLAMSNGRIGMLTSPKPFQIKHTVLNNVYDVDPFLKVSQIVHGMNFANLDIYIDGEKITEENISNWSQTMDMKSAAFTTRFSVAGKANISCTIYALRNLQYTGYVDIKIDALQDIEVKAVGKIEVPKNFQKPNNTCLLYTSPSPRDA